MKINIGKTDKTIRLLLAITIGFADIYFKSWWGLVGIVPLLTGAISYCPLYSIFGINTCDVRKA